MRSTAHPFFYLNRSRTKKAEIDSTISALTLKKTIITYLAVANNSFTLVQLITLKNAFM